MGIEPLPQCKHWITSPTHYPCATAPDNNLYNSGRYKPKVVETRPMYLSAIQIHHKHIFINIFSLMVQGSIQFDGKRKRERERKREKNIKEIKEKTKSYLDHVLRTSSSGCTIYIPIFVRTHKTIIAAIKCHFTLKIQFVKLSIDVCNCIVPSSFSTSSHSLAFICRGRFFLTSRSKTIFLLSDQSLSSISD